jgi:CRP/FNR family transcriptional regulator, anaerobic regulatory protein
LIPQHIFQEIVKFYPVIDELPASLQQAIQCDGLPVQAKPGRLAFDYGDRCSSFLLFVSGSVRVVKAIGQGREMLLYMIRPGDSCILTVSGILGNKPYPARGIWDDESVVYAISADLFNLLIAESTAFRTFIFRSFSEKISHLMELVDAMIWRPVASRLAQLLVDKGDQNTIHYSHQMLANELGTVREVVSRTLEEFERQGMVHLERMQISIQNREGLETIARVKMD